MALTTAEIKLSAVSNVGRTKTRSLSFGNVLEDIRGKKYATEITKIRTLQDAGKIDEAKGLKKKLPAILFAGTFSKRNKQSLVQHSGLLVLDFDECDLGLKQDLASDPYSVFCFLSPRGTGIKLVIRIEPATSPEEHEESFDAARKYYFERYGIDADPTGRDVSRLCFFSHDPDAVYCAEGEVLHRLHRQHMTTHDHADNVGKEREQQDSSCRQGHTIDEIIRMTQPTQPGQRHRQIFNLARGLAFECDLKEEPLKDLKPIVRRWFDMATDKIATQAFSESWSDFVHAWPRVEKPLSTNTLSSAWDAVQEGEFWSESLDYDDLRIQKLVSLCWHLGRDSETFYLSTHKAGALLDVQPMQILRWLNMLQVDDVVKLVKKGNRGLASTYRWLDCAPA